RLSPRLIQKLRARLGVSQVALARLVGVTGAAGGQWEHGRASPAGERRRAGIALRGLGRREVNRLLERMPKPTAKPARRAGRSTPRRRARPSTRTRRLRRTE